MTVTTQSDDINRCRVFFFFSSRRRHTRCSRDWSSDVCSSDLDAEVRILRVPPFAQGIARRAVEEYVLEQTHGEPATVTNKWLDEAIRKLLPTHMQLIMGIGTAEEIALAEVKAQEQMKIGRAHV